MKTARGPRRSVMRVTQTFTAQKWDRKLTVSFIDTGGNGRARRLEAGSYPPFDEEEAWFVVEKDYRGRITFIERCDPPPGYRSPLDDPRLKAVRAINEWLNDPDRDENARPDSSMMRASSERHRLVDLITPAANQSAFPGQAKGAVTDESGAISLGSKDFGMKVGGGGRIGDGDAVDGAVTGAKGSRSI